MSRLEVRWFYREQRRQMPIISTEVQRPYERVVIRAEPGFAASHVQAPAVWQPIEHVIQPQQSAKRGTPVGHPGLRKLARRFSECEIREPEPGVEVAGENGRLLIVQERREPAGLSSTAVLRSNPPTLRAPHVVEMRRHQPDAPWGASRRAALDVGGNRDSP